MRDQGRRRDPYTCASFTLFVWQTSWCLHIQYTRMGDLNLLALILWLDLLQISKLHSLPPSFLLSSLLSPPPEITVFCTYENRGFSYFSEPSDWAFADILEIPLFLYLSLLSHFLPLAATPLILHLLWLSIGPNPIFVLLGPWDW
jgi:hypothetical protein